MAASADPTVLDLPPPSQGVAETQQFGRTLLRHWDLDPAIRHINHGAFGAAPCELLDEQARWRRIMESNPARFFMKDMTGYLRSAAAELAGFVGTEPERLAFVDNATVGTCTVLRELDLEPGDEVLTTDHVYSALRNAIRHVAGLSGAHLCEMALPAPVTESSQILEAIRAGLTARTRLVVIDHVASGSATTFPVQAIAELCRERGVPLLIDGAHAPGLLDLDIDAIGADWYVGNCHKWLCAPKGAAFLVASREPAAAIHPLAISHAYGQSFAAEFDKTGTRDVSAWLCIPAAIRFHQRLGGRALRQRNRGLARRIAEGLARGTGMTAACGLDLCQAMVALKLPGSLAATRETSAAVHGFLYERHGFEAAITAIAGALHLRISVQAYNDESDYDGLGPAVLAAAEAAA